MLFPFFELIEERLSVLFAMEHHQHDEYIQKSDLMHILHISNFTKDQLPL